ncbi:hypothetical protein K3495_g7162 [Podosphaera aphanis]|nr:hypothetical protein K3495_g7162 [Podosphaera aphanis]
MESSRTKLKSLQVNLLSDHENPGLPSISSLFLILFDNKIGYSIEWKRSLPPIQIEGIVEYKSLPSGLHSVKEDLIYFVHDTYVGLSAFSNAPATEDLRNACMIAVGVLIPLCHSGLERSWKHAEQLKEIASKLASDTSATHVLEDYWEQYKVHDSYLQDGHVQLPNLPSFPKLTMDEPEAQAGTSPVSNSSPTWPLGKEDSMIDPRWDIASLLETFGPLIFPIHRAALLRKRILIMTCAPVKETCNCVYGISVLSTISHLSTQSASSQRLRPLFSIGVTDIPLLGTDLVSSPGVLEKDEFSSSGWIACTTDKIIATKSSLYDILITMSSPHSTDGNQKYWPRVESSQGVEIKATQRDLRRYKTLQWGLSRYPLHPPRAINKGSTISSESGAPFDASSLNASKLQEDPPLDLPGAENITEPLTWSALAYSGILWWTLTAEQQTESLEETDADIALMTEFQLPLQSPSDSGPAGATASDTVARHNSAITSYFCYLTAQVFNSFTEIVDATEPQDTQSDDILFESATGDSEDELRPAVLFNKADVARVGLDIWSAADHVFIQNFADKYFGRRATVEQTRIEICGIRIC